MSRHNAWRNRLDRIRHDGQYRTLKTLEPTGPVTARLNGNSVLVACSNDYLGLAWDPQIRAAAVGGGSTGSRLISGSRPIHRQLEEALEERFGRPALLFNSGYQANLAVFSTLAVEGDRIASDRANHASMIDGMRLSSADRTVFDHARPQTIPDDTTLIATEGLFSMDGDVPDLRHYPTAPWLAVDEAHAFGALGPQGRGIAAAQGVEPDVIVGTFGKAMGGSGAFVVGPPELKELLINAGRSFIFTTAMPEPVAAMALASLTRNTREQRERLAHNAAYLRRNLSQQGWTVLGQHHILPVVVGTRAVDLSDALLSRGVFAPAIRYPTVPRGKERIRLTVSAAHEHSHLNKIASAIGVPAHLER